MMSRRKLNCPVNYLKQSIRWLLFNQEKTSSIPWISIWYVQFLCGYETFNTDSFIVPSFDLHSMSVHTLILSNYSRQLIFRWSIFLLEKGSIYVNGKLKVPFHFVLPTNPPPLKKSLLWHLTKFILIHVLLIPNLLCVRL